MSVSDILIQLASHDNGVRSQAETIVANEQQNNFANFCLALLAELQDDSKPAESRQMAGVLLKNSVALDVRNRAQREVLDARWKALGADLRTQVKSAVVATLGSTAKPVRMVASLIIANLARIELPYGEWPDLIQTLVGGCDSGVPSYMEAALTSLGYIAEEAFSHDDLADILENQSELVIRAICAGMCRTESDVIYAATNALANSLEFVGEHMKNPEIQKFIVSTVCDTVGNSDANIRERAMRCLVKVSDLYYSLLPNFIHRCFEVTSAAINNKSESEAVILQALLFWIALCENERELLENEEECSGFAAGGCSLLVDMCMSTMLRQVETQTEEDWNVSTAGSKLLQSLSETVCDPVVPLVMKFVYAHINSADWRYREAAMMAFGCIMVGPDPESFANTVAQGVSVYVDGLTDPHPLVADTAGWVTSVVCDNFPNIFTMNAEQCQKLIVEKVGPMINGANTTMCVRACSIIHNLALSYEDEDDEGGMPTNCFSPFYQSIVTALLSRIDRDPDPEAFGRDRKLAIEALNALIDAAANDVSSVITNLVPALIDRINFFVKQYNSAPSDDTLIVEGLLCGSLSAVCKKMGKHVVPFTDTIMNVLSSVFSQQANSSVEEGIMLLGTLAVATGPDFGPYAALVIDLVLKCATNFEEEDLCDAAVGVIGDFATSLGPQGFAPIMEKVVNAVFGALINPDVDRDQKLVYFGCAGDISLHTGETFTPYVPSLMGIAQSAFNDSCNLDMKDDPDTTDYVMELWERLCQLCGLILQGQRDVAGSIATYAPNILVLADHVCRNSAAISEETFSAALGLIGDVANVCCDKPQEAQTVGPLLMAPNISECLSRGANMKGEPHKQATWANKQVHVLMGRRH